MTSLPAGRDSEAKPSKVRIADLGRGGAGAAVSAEAPQHSSDSAPAGEDEILELKKALLSSRDDQVGTLRRHLGQLTTLQSALSKAERARQTVEQHKLALERDKQQLEQEKRSLEGERARLEAARYTAEKAIAQLSEYTHAKEQDKAELQPTQAELERTRNALHRAEADPTERKLELEAETSSLRMRIAELGSALESQRADGAQINELSSTINNLHAELSLARGRSQDLEYALKQSWIAAAQRSASIARMSNRNLLLNIELLARMRGWLRSKLTRPARRVLAKFRWFAFRR